MSKDQTSDFRTIELSWVNRGVHVASGLAIFIILLTHLYRVMQSSREDSLTSPQLQMRISGSSGNLSAKRFELKDIFFCFFFYVKSGSLLFFLLPFYGNWAVIKQQTNTRKTMPK